MSLIVDILTVLISGFWCIKNFKKITQSSRYIIFYVFVVFYVLPIMLDLFALPNYYTNSSRYYGFILSHSDMMTRVIYDFGVLLCETLILFLPRSRRTVLFCQQTNENCSIDNRPLITILLIAGMCLPVVLTLIYPVNKGILYTFQWREHNLFAYDANVRRLEQLTYIAVCCCLVLLFKKRTVKNVTWLFSSLICIVFLFMNICIEGKRSILFFTLLIFLVSIIPGLQAKNLSSTEKKRKLFKLVRLAFLFFSIMVVVSVIVKTTSRGYDSSALYTQLRIDFFRDDRVLMSIYSMLNPEKMKILPSFGKTIFSLIYWIYPFSKFMTTETYQFQEYFSAALQNVEVGKYSAFMPAGIYAELIANFGFLGILLMPILCIGLADIADRVEYPVNVLVIISFIGLQIYSVNYYMLMYEFILIVLIVYKSKDYITIHRRRRR